MDWGAIATISIWIIGSIIAIAWKTGWFQRQTEDSNAAMDRLRRDLEHLKRDLRTLEAELKRDVRTLEIDSARRDEALHNLQQFRSELLQVISRIEEKIHGM